MDKKIIEQFRQHFLIDEDEVDKSAEVLMNFTVRDIEQFILQVRRDAIEEAEKERLLLLKRRIKINRNHEYDDKEMITDIESCINNRLNQLKNE